MVGMYLKYPEKRDMIEKFGIMSCVSKIINLKGYDGLKIQ